MVRKPTVAGQFYKEDPAELNEEIKQCFKKGPGALKEKKRGKEIKAIISPHAGYFFSGKGAAWCFKELAESKIPDIYIMIGLSHRGHRSCISMEDWETPLGIVKTDKDFGQLLLKNSKLRQDEKAHAEEHSIEVELPFLQYINKGMMDKIKILPIVVSPDFSYIEIARNIKNAIDLSKKKVIIITSSDFTHYGINYGYMPFTADAKENLYALDKKAIDFITSLNPAGFLTYIKKTGATICGQLPIAVTLELCILMGAKKSRLLNYYTSGDIISDYSSAVGYASIVFE
jgi:AmmeMemoRadiSam system protein B